MIALQEGMPAIKEIATSYKKHSATEKSQQQPEWKNVCMKLQYTSVLIVFKNWDGRAWTGLIWIRIGTGGGLLWMQ